MRNYRWIFCLFLFFLFSSYTFAEEKCTNNKIEDLKKHIANVSMVSAFDEEGEKIGIYGRYLVTLYELPKGFYVKNRTQSVLFVYSDLKEGVATRYVNYDVGKFYVYSYDCPNQALKEFDLKLKKYNIYHNYVECDGIEEGELDVCNKFCEKNITYSQFIKSVEKYKNSKKEENNRNNLFTMKNIIIVSVLSLLLLFVIVLLLVKKSKKNRLD